MTAAVIVLLFAAILLYAGLHNMSVTDVFNSALGRHPSGGLGSLFNLGNSSTSGGTGTGGPTGNLGSSSNGGGFLPKGALFKIGRKDQGQDGQTNPGGPIIAPGSGTVLHILSDPNGFGPNYPVVHFDTGPYAGQDVYIGHTHTALSPGAKFSPGTILSYTGTTGVGNATVPGWFEIGYAPGGYPGPMGQPVPF